MDRLLRGIMLVLGLAIVVIGAAHILFGAGIIVGAGTFSASIDSEDRFFGAIFLGYGLVWIWCAREPDDRLVLFLSAIFFLGGLARLISIWQVGTPENLYLALTAVELILPAVIVAMARRGVAQL